MKIISFTVTLFALAAMVACTVRPDQYVQKGNKLFDSGRYADAEINYQKAIQKDSNFGEAYFRLGMAQSRDAHPDAAYATLARAADLLQNREEVAVALADAALAAYLQRGQAVYYDRVVGISASLLKKNSKSYDGLRLQGYVAMIDHRFADAESALREANAIKPMQEETVHALVQCLMQDQQGPEAEKLALSLIHERKSFAPVYDALYAYYTASNRIADAEALLKTKVANNPETISYRLQLAGHYARTKNEAEMSATIQEIKSSKYFPNAPMEIGNFLVSTNRLDDAIHEFQTGAKVDPQKRTEYQDRIAAVLMEQGKADQALALVKEIIKGHQNDFDARSMQASINVDSGDPARLREGLTDLQTLAKEKPGDANVRLNLGRARLKGGDANGALSDFKEALSINPGMLQARMLAANTSLQTMDYKAAQQYADQILQIASDNPMARLIRVESDAGLGNFTAATNDAIRLDKQYPNAIEPKLELASLAFSQKKLSEAESMFRSLYIADRKDTRALRGLLDVYYSQNRYDAAIQFLTKETAMNNSIEIRSLLADAALRGRRLDVAVQQYTLLTEADPKSPVNHLKLGDAYLQTGDTTRAITQFQTAQSLAPKDPLVNSMLALSFHNAGKTQEAQQAYRAALALDSGNPLVMNNLAYLIAETGGALDEALKLAQDASRRQPANVALSDTVGWIYLKKNLPDSAVQVLANVVQKSPDTAIYRYHLGAALLQKGDKLGARVQLDAALARGLDNANHAKLMELMGKIR